MPLMQTACALPGCSELELDSSANPPRSRCVCANSCTHQLTSPFMQSSFVLTAPWSVRTLSAGLRPSTAAGVSRLLGGRSSPVREALRECWEDAARCDRRSDHSRL